MKGSHTAGSYFPGIPEVPTASTSLWAGWTPHDDLLNADTYINCTITGVNKARTYPSKTSRLQAELLYHEQPGSQRNKTTQSKIKNINELTSDYQSRPVRVSTAII